MASPSTDRSKLKWQILSFLIIVISSIGLYFGVIMAVGWLTWFFMLLIGLGMAMAVWSS